MSILTVASQKGGVGKTTLALALAVRAEAEGWPTAVLDLDPQATATLWGDWRGANLAPPVFAAQAPRLSRIIDELREQGARLIVLDTPPQANQTTDAALEFADLILMPARPTAFDAQSVAATARAAAAKGKPAVAVLNACRPRSGLTEEVARALVQAGIELCPVRIGDRADFQSPLANGRTAGEWQPRGKAALEIAELWEWLAVRLTPKASRGRRKPANTLT